MQGDDALLAVDDVVSARVTAVHPHGLDIEARGRPGFVQPIELSWDPRVSARDVASVGDTVTVRVYAVTDARFYASIKRARPDLDPWCDPERFAVGTRHRGRVDTVHDWGAFVEIAPLVVGLVGPPSSLALATPSTSR